MKYGILLLLVVCCGLKSMENAYEVIVPKKNTHNHLENLLLYSSFKKGSISSADDEWLATIGLSQKFNRSLLDYPMRKEILADNQETFLLYPRSAKDKGGYDYAILDSKGLVKDGWASAIDIDPHYAHYMACALFGALIYIEPTNTNKTLYIFSSVVPGDEKKLKKGKNTQALVRSLAYDTQAEDRLFSATKGFNYISLHDLNHTGAIVKIFKIAQTCVRSLTHLSKGVNNMILYTDDDRKLNAVMLNAAYFLGTITLTKSKDKRSVVVVNPLDKNNIFVWNHDGCNSMRFRFERYQEGVKLVKNKE